MFVERRHSIHRPGVLGRHKSKLECRIYHLWSRLWHHIVFLMQDGKDSNSQIVKHKSLFSELPRYQYCACLSYVLQTTWSINYKNDMLHYITLHLTHDMLIYTTLNTWQSHVTLPCTRLYYTALHCTALHCTALHYTTLHLIHDMLHYTTLHYTTLHYTTLHTLYYTTLNTWHVALPCTSLNTWHVTLHYTIRYNTILYYTILY